MAENGRLCELIAELLAETKQMRQDFNLRIERLEETQKKTNLLLQLCRGLLADSVTSIT